MANLQFMAAWMVGLTVLQLASTAPYQQPTPTTDSGRAALAPVLGKRFKLDHCDNLDGVLQAVRMNETLRSIAQNLTYSLVLNEDNGEYTLTTDGYLSLASGPVKILTSNATFRIGQEIEVTNVDLETVKAVITQNGNTLTEERNGKTPGTTIRIFTPEQVKTIVKVKNATNNCIYKPE